MKIMTEKGFWERYGLMLAGILIYGIDLACMFFVTQQLYKNIVNIVLIL